MFVEWRMSKVNYSCLQFDSSCRLPDSELGRNVIRVQHGVEEGPVPECTMK